MSNSDANPPLGGGALLSGLLFGAWIGVCDSWIKVLARAGACDSTATLDDALTAVWTLPPDCSPVALVGDVSLQPTARAGATPFELPVPEGMVAVYGLALLAVAAVVGIVVLRWSRRTRSDALAVGTLWGGLVLHAVPRMMDAGSSFAEFSMSGVHVGLADLAIVWAVAWLLWRALAELRG
ncbi:MAG: hypothetical protein ACRBN8_11630 [Nannocystales bacterium]